MRKNNFILAFMLMSSCAFAQDSLSRDTQPTYIKGHMTVTAAYSKSILDPFEIMKDNIIISTRAMKGGNIQVLYGVNNWLECGLSSPHIPMLSWRNGQDTLAFSILASVFVCRPLHFRAHRGVNHLFSKRMACRTI